MRLSISISISIQLHVAATALQVGRRRDFLLQLAEFIVELNIVLEQLFVVRVSNKTIANRMKQQQQKGERKRAIDTHFCVELFDSGIELLRKERSK